MPLSFKINTALVISIAFMFRLLFINVSIISSLAHQKTSNFKSTQPSEVIKNGVNLKAVNNSTGAECSFMEICEEEGDSDSQLKANPFHFIQVLYSTVAGELENNFQKKLIFNNSLYHISSDRYLKLQVFRI